MKTPRKLKEEEENKEKEHIIQENKIEDNHALNKTIKWYDTNFNSFEEFKKEEETVKKECPKKRKKLLKKNDKCQ